MSSTHGTKTTRKHSAKRQAILNALRATTGHPSAQTIYDNLRPSIPELSLGTVYRNLGLFLRDGDAVSVGVVDGEERFDGETRPHVHFVCEKCKKVFDLPEFDMSIVEGAFANRFPELALDKERTVFSGLCQTCANASNNAKTPA